MFHPSNGPALKNALYAIESPADYDSLTARVVPGYAELSSRVALLLTFPAGRPVKILDLGTGTGQTAKTILDANPNATLVGVDKSPKMLEIGRMRLGDGYPGRLELVSMDMSDYVPASGFFDAIVGVLSVHHLDGPGKKRLFKKLYGGLKPGGRLVLGDVVTFPTPEETSVMEKKWYDYLVGEFGTGGADYWLAKYRDEDSPSPASSQLEWMRDAGFANPVCDWSHGNHAVMWATK